jgi:hypothetical protein
MQQLAIGLQMAHKLPLDALLNASLKVVMTRVKATQLVHHLLLRLSFLLRGFKRLLLLFERERNSCICHIEQSRAWFQSENHPCANLSRKYSKNGHFGENQRH